MRGVCKKNASVLFFLLNYLKTIAYSFTCSARKPGYRLLNNKEFIMMQLLYSNMNQLYFLLWKDQVVEIYASRLEAIEDLRFKGLKVAKDNKVSVR